MSRAAGSDPCSRGFALSVPLLRGETLVPLTAEGISVLAPLAGALALVRASGGFQTQYVDSTGIESCMVFERVPCMEGALRRLRSVARELLALGADALPARDRQRFRPAIELRASGEQTLCVQIYGEGPAATDERVLHIVSRGMLLALTSLVERKPQISSRQLQRQSVLARCCVRVEDLMASIGGSSPLGLPRERQAVRNVLRELAAARSLPALACAQNDAVLASVASTARALRDNDQWIVNEGHCHAERFGTTAPLARLKFERDVLVGTLQLPSGRLLLAEKGHDSTEPAPLLPELSRTHSADVSACVGLAAHLARAVRAVAQAGQRAEEFCVHSILVVPRALSDLSAGLPASR